jgi:O-antigen biosynthesis protein
MGGLVARGKYLFDGERKFHVRGVSYGPFPVNSRGERYPEPERTAADFLLMRAMGVNTVRVYVPPPPWMFDAALAAGLRLMIGIPWPFHMAFLDEPGMAAEIRETIRKGVTEMRSHAGAILAFSLGNEVRSDIVRWHGPRAVSRFLSELYDLGKQLAPDTLFTYSNYPSAEYLDLNFLDFVSFNVYLHREADFRRYLTHLMGITGERPLVLSETGMDTIREGEPHQAELLAWQGRAAFELGLSGFIVFAFTDEWHTGGAEITDWAFGLVRKDRSPKLAVETIKQIYTEPLPPALRATPKVSIVVPAFNAGATLGACLDSLKMLNYPDYETIVVDDGSTDSTSAVANERGVRALRLEHRGLAAARNAGAAAAAGEIVAYIDADARADRDWLYHLVATITRRDAAAAGGPNFAPEPASATAAALAAAPGLPREVRAGDDRLAQLCGCNMAIRKSALEKAGGFDEMFTTAGDDTDFSWRLTAAGELLAYAPGAVVIHERRSTLASYLEQQRGYGDGEGLLYLKYPQRKGSQDGMYASPSWFASFFSRGRIYYGAFGRGLFQTVYSSGPSILEFAMSAPWVITAAIFALSGLLDEPAIGALGVAGLLVTLSSLILYTSATPLPRRYSRFGARFMLGFATIRGSLQRSWSRTWGRWLQFQPTGEERAGMRFRINDRLTLEPATPNEVATSASVLEALRGSLIRRGLPVAESDGFQSYDLRIIRQFGNIDINAIRADSRVQLIWRTRPVWRTTLSLYVLLLVIDFATGMTAVEAIGATIGLLILLLGGFVFTAMRYDPVIRNVAGSVAAAFGARIVEEPR